MSMVSFGDLAQSFLLKAHTARLKSAVAQNAQELASGRLSDPGAAVQGDFSKIAALNRAAALVSGHNAAATEAAFTTAAMQTAISTISESASDLVSELMLAPQNGMAGTPAILADQARSHLAGTLERLNISAGGRSLFAGDQVTATAVVDADTILAALRIELAGTTNAQDAMARVSAWFDSPAGYQAVACTGGPPVQDAQVSATEKVWLGATATDPGFREILKGLAAAALIDDGAFTMPDAERRSFARLSGAQLMTGEEALTTLAARIGVSQSRIEAAQSRNSAELSTIEIARSDLLDSDPYKLAIQLEASQTNLEMMYSITSRLSALHLTDYLR